MSIPCPSFTLEKYVCHSGQTPSSSDAGRSRSTGKRDRAVAYGRARLSFRDPTGPSHPTSSGCRLFSPAELGTMISQRSISQPGRECDADREVAGSGRRRVSRDPGPTCPGSCVYDARRYSFRPLSTFRPSGDSGRDRTFSQPITPPIHLLGDSVRWRSETSCVPVSGLFRVPTAAGFGQHDAGRSWGGPGRTTGHGGRPFLSFFPRSPTGGGGGLNAKRRVLAATAETLFSDYPPIVAWG